jgi:hypothetical protein
MAIKTGTGCSIAIGTVLAAPNGTQAEYEADSYVSLGEVESIGQFGDQRSSVTFASLADGRMQKARGVADAGDAVITFAHKTSDAGAVALKAAFAATSQATDEFNFRIQLADTISTSPTKFYFRARVMGIPLQEIQNDGVVRVQATLAINTAVLEVDATWARASTGIYSLRLRRPSSVRSRRKRRSCRPTKFWPGSRASCEWWRPQDSGLCTTTTR